MGDCNYCEKKFSSKSNRVRHERLFHKQMDEEEESVNSESEGTDSSGESAESEDTDGSNGQEENRIWEQVLKAAYSELDLGDSTSSDFFQSKGSLKAITSAMANKITEWQHAVTFLSDHSDTYQKLEKTKQRLMKTEDYSDEEATVKAFKDRRSLLKDIIIENKHVLKNLLGEVDDSQ